MNQQHPYHVMLLNQNFATSLPKSQPQPQSPQVLIPSLSQSQTQQRLSQLYSSNPNQLLALSGKHSPPSDFNVEPTKRLRVNSQEFSQSPIKIQDNFLIKPMSQRVEDIQTQSNISLDYLKQQLKLSEGVMRGYEVSKDMSMETVDDPLMKLAAQDRLKGDQDLQKLAQLRQQLSIGSKLDKTSDNIPRLSPVLAPAYKDEARNIDLDSSLMMGFPQLGYSPELLEMYKAQYYEHLMNQHLVQQTQQQWLEHLERQKAEHRSQQQLLQHYQQQQLDLMMHQTLASQMQRRLQYEQLSSQMSQETPRNKLSDITPPKKNSPYDFASLNSGKEGRLDNKGVSGLQQSLTMNQSAYMQSELKPIKKTLSNDDGIFKKLLERPEQSQSVLNNGVEAKSAGESTEKNSPYEYIITRNERTSRDNIKDKGMAEETIALKKVYRQQAKKKKLAYNFSNVMSIAALNELKDKNEPRKLNRWQLMAQKKNGQLDSGMLVEGQTGLAQGLTGSAGAGQGLNGASSGAVNGLAAGNVKENLEPKRRGGKNLIPEVEDPNKDWRGLLGVTITKDPQYEGTELENKKFKVIDYYERMKTLRGEDGEAPINTNVGRNFQATIPEMDLTSFRAETKKKKAELVWNPKAIDEKEVERYFEDLTKLLGEGSINEEKALKLLKRKNYKRDKVRVNISKNEKFYSSFLVVSEAGKEAKQDEIAVENGVVNNYVNNIL